MSKLDNIILDCVNKVLDGKEEKLGDYIDPTKDQVKSLMLEVIQDIADKYAYQTDCTLNDKATLCEIMRKKVESL